MVEEILANRTILTFLGGIAGGTAGFGIWTLVQRFLPRPTLWVFVGVMAFIGARAFPAVFLPTAPQVLEKPGEPHLTDAPVQGDVRAPQIYPRGSIDPASIGLIATLSARDPAFENILTSQLGAGPQPEADVLSFALTYGAQAAQDFIPYATDQPILDLAEVLAIISERLTQRDAKACYGWLYGGYGFEPFVFADYFEATGRGLIDYQLALYAAIV